MWESVLRFWKLAERERTIWKWALEGLVVKVLLRFLQILVWGDGKKPKHITCFYITTSLLVPSKAKPVSIATTS